MTLDEGKIAFDQLINLWDDRLKLIDNEADTRFKLIDEILSKVLGWNRLDDFNLEHYSASGFADYLLSADGRARMVVEAKHKNSMLVGTRAKSTQYLAVNSAALKNSQVGFKQAQGYCVDNGALFSVLTSGIEWIAYLAVREHGKRPSDGKVIIFPNLESISQDFAQFWDLFSREAVVAERYRIRIREIEGLRILATETLRPILKSNDKKFLQKSQLAQDVERIFKEFFSSMVGKNDPEMLANCFVESKESRDADNSLEKITSTLVNRLELMSSDKGEQLQRHLQEAVESQRGEFVLIVGNKGAGKTTFIDRFFSIVLPHNLQESCVVVRIDVGNSTGEAKTIVEWLDRQILLALETAIFKNGIASNDQLQGIFYSEYCRWKEGPHKILYETKKDEFKIKFGEYLEDLRSNQTHIYIERILKDIVDNRHKMPCIVFDNTDHFSESFQESVFQYAQSLFRSSFNFIICPITDRTIWELSKHGPLQSYDTTSFYLPIPSMKNVLEKRVNFIRKKLVESDQSAKGEYFVGKGIRLNVQDISAFAACVEEIFIANEGISKIIGGLANFDIRRSLQLTQGVVTSPHIKIEELVKLYLTDGRLPIKLRSIYQAILCGDSNHFSQDASHFVINQFEVSGDDLTSPLLELSILRFFIDVDSQSSQNIQDLHASVEDTIGYFNSMGIAHATIKAHLQKMTKFGLLATFDAAETQLVEETRLRVTSAGKIHYEWALGNSTYLTETALATPLRSCPARDEMLTLWSAQGKKSREAWDEFMRRFAEYCIDQDAMFIVVPSMAAYRNQIALRDQFRNRWAQRTLL
jgi:predicted type IV restriction endonuclease